MKGKTALVTGAAGGVGAAVVRAIAERGGVPAAVDADGVALKEKIEALSTEGLRAEGFTADVTRRDEADATVAAVEAQLGPVDYLVNAAGILRLAEARHLSDTDWADTLAVNATGVFHMSQAVVNRMVPRRSGAVVTVASNAAGTPRKLMAAYAASKAAATMFTKCLGLEVAEYGIRCNLVAPGSTDTPMLNSMWHDDSGREATIRGDLAAYKLGIPLGKLATPQDVADAVVFLLSEEAAHITMHALTVDGGATLGV
ncbi:2,3-dihydro-2,3-dihydroxybenzoate dehydrogenase [Streptomyces sp. MP131-18]|uniref:2,3-dihydro-2,3-dihydroxybenzoate dehydrogenase n=1 Tax=Streptomyces sp. MP131-18 TaxID=1857892 RepID=UPI00097C8B83|nr:2,3-dihydro-2,3-dihydroxybenzoate dehydrogenase [Streptomyces sp. MP131-18]